MIPVTEFRTMPVSSLEPADRTTAGTILGDDAVLALGSVDITDEAQDTPVNVIWWRVTDMKGNSGIINIRIWISDTEGMEGHDTFYMDITDLWTQNKTPVQVKTGNPGTAPLEEPQAKLFKNGGGSITGITHEQTSKYIYIAGNIGVDETTGNKTGLKIKVKFDYW